MSADCGRSSFSYILRMVETAVSVGGGKILDWLVALSIMIAAPFSALFLDLPPWTPGVENPVTFIGIVFYGELSRELDVPPLTPSLKKPLVFVPNAGVSTNFFR